VKLVQFGAGNIGRSFIGALFSRSGWDVVFVDVDPRIVELLNERRFYTVVIKREGKDDELRRIGPVRAVNGGDVDAVSAEIAGADMASASVGKAALPRILPYIAAGLKKRQQIKPEPLNIIIAENVRNAREIFSTGLAQELGPAYPLAEMVGLIETSIGKMVPLMKKEDLEKDPLCLFAEEYETLILDRRGFRGPLPDVEGLCPVDTIQAWVDRKLFIHNLGHAAAAYLGFQMDPKKRLIADVLDSGGLERQVRSVMYEAAGALAMEYPESYSLQDLSDHIEDLLMRFRNRSLGDTLHRVGRDLSRKLSRDDRLTGAMLLCAQKNVPFNNIAAAYKAALDFAAPDENGNIFPADVMFREEVLHNASPETVLQSDSTLKIISGLDAAREADKKVIETLRRLK
jgi:mannitol-1-phosphate 5-dehydrogenase